MSLCFFQQKQPPENWRLLLFFKDVCIVYGVFHFQSLVCDTAVQEDWSEEWNIARSCVAVGLILYCFVFVWSCCMSVVDVVCFVQYFVYFAGLSFDNFYWMEIVVGDYKFFVWIYNLFEEKLIAWYKLVIFVLFLELFCGICLTDFADNSFYEHNENYILFVYQIVSCCMFCIYFVCYVYFLLGYCQLWLCVWVGVSE